MSESSKAAVRLTHHILIGLVLGALVGAALNHFSAGHPWLQTYITAGILKLIADLFRNGLMLLVVPLVFFSLTSGVASLGSPSQLGRLGLKTIGLYILTTVMAVTMALALAVWIQPGSGLAELAASFEPPVAPPLADVISNMVPRNPVQAMAEMQMLQIIVFAVLLGLAITMAKDAGQRAAGMIEDWNTVVLQLVTIVMKFAPIGVFALLARAVAEFGFDTLKKLAIYFILVLVALALHLFVILPTLLKLVARLNPMIWLRKMSEVWLFAFSTSSSNATLPVNLRVCEERLGVSNRVAAFSIPLGATINMDGTVIMQGIATVFIAQLYAVDLTMAQLLTVVAMATLAAVGTAGVPSAGMIMLASVLAQVGLPVEAIGIILSVDRLLDMARTLVNTSGDAAVACIVAQSEGELDLAVYNGE
ncbi:MAG: dicarboxylate/amino acid:cation symporter [Lysobacterales bacterium]|nr:dicarboxylate/amino acid:cation symporter [Xanthomonadales bacterium]MCP5476420.1 dicarboxylate/amino acid:cation symporter [Rhodanobacteraceae bacterium]